MTNNKPISKFKLLSLIKKYSQKNIIIKPFDKKVINKSFKDTRNELNLLIPTYEIMIRNMINHIKQNKNLYNHYKIKFE